MSQIQSVIPLDYECTWWPDIWFGVSITDCCIAHDLGGSDLQLATCVFHAFPLSLKIPAAVLAVVMLVGITLALPIRKLPRK